MNAHRPRARLTRMKIRDQRQGGRDVERFADAHERPAGKHLGISGAMAGRPRHRRPDEQAADDRPAAIEFVRDETPHRAQERVHPHEDGHERAEILIVGDAGNIGANRGADSGDHLPVEVIEHRHRPEQGDDCPGVGGR